MKILQLPLWRIGARNGYRRQVDDANDSLYPARSMSLFIYTYIYIYIYFYISLLLDPLFPYRMTLSIPLDNRTVVGLVHDIGLFEGVPDQIVQDLVVVPFRIDHVGIVQGNECCGGCQICPTLYGGVFIVHFVFPPLGRGRITAIIWSIVVIACRRSTIREIQSCDIHTLHLQLLLLW